MMVKKLQTQHMKLQTDNIIFFDGPIIYKYTSSISTELLPL